MDDATYDSLTIAERDVLRRLAAGRRPSEIAVDVGRSVSTIRNQLHSARHKAASSDSVSVARALTRYEADGQTLPEQTLSIADVPSPVPSPAHQPRSVDQAALEFREDRVIFDLDASPPLQVETDESGSRHDLIPSPTAKLAVILGLTVLAMMCVALAPEMGDTAQRVADLLYPTKP